jgi:hypothetical protein
MAIKNIKIDKDNSIKIDSSINWLLIYRAQFGRDILPDILPLISAGVDIAINILGESEGETVQEKIANMDSDKIESAMLSLAGLELTTFLQIVWAMDANARKKNGEEIVPFENWVEQQEEFPIDLIAPAVAGLLTKSMVSSKNLKRLQDLVKMAKAENVTKSAQMES